jgi:hypothetical protein
MKEELTDEEKLAEVERRLDGIFPREYYSIEWPIVSRKWEFGTCLKEILDANKVYKS